MPSVMPSSARASGPIRWWVVVRRVRDEALGVAQVVGDLDQPQRVEAAEGAGLAAFDFERDHLAAARHLLFGERVPAGWSARPG